MMIWIVIALLTCVAVLSVLWPLSGPAPAPGEDAADVAFYRAQIAEIDAEMSRGAIAPDQAEAAKAEAGRRLLAVAPAEAAAIDSPVARARAIALATFCVPLIALGIYARIGSPQLADMPPEATRNAAPEQTGLAGAVGKMESYLDAHKDDGRALELMTPAYLQMGRFDDAVKSSRRAIEILGESPDRLATYAEALSYANDGIVSPEAVDQLERALALDAKNLRARFFLGLAAAQHDDSAKAREIWTAMLSEMPDASPAKKDVQDKLALLDAPVEGAGPAPDGAAQEQKTIRAMVDNLAERLSAHGGTLEEWTRLIRSYKVLNEPDKAADACDRARKAFPGDEAAQRRLADLVRELGLGAK